MAVTNYPIFVQAPKHSVGQVSAANTNRDGTGTIVSIITGGADATRIQKIRAKAVATSTAGMVRIYHKSGVNIRLIYEFIVTAITAAAAVKTWEDELFFPEGYFLNSGDTIEASTHNAETFNIHIDYGDY